MVIPPDNRPLFYVQSFQLRSYCNEPQIYTSDDSHTVSQIISDGVNTLWDTGGVANVVILYYSVLLVK